MVDELNTKTKSIESINENNSITNETIRQTIDNLIEVNIICLIQILQIIWLLKTLFFLNCVSYYRNRNKSMESTKQL